MPVDIDALSREVDSPVRLALAALKANPPHKCSPLPWTVDCSDLSPPDVLCSTGLAVSVGSYGQDAAHIAAAVNAAPVLAAEVERLTALLAAARWKVEQLPRYEEHMCTIEVLGANDLDLANEALDRARRAVGLEG